MNNAELRAALRQLASADTLDAVLSCEELKVLGDAVGQAMARKALTDHEDCAACRSFRQGFSRALASESVAADAPQPGVTYERGLSSPEVLDALRAAQVEIHWDPEPREGVPLAPLGGQVRVTTYRSFRGEGGDVRLDPRPHAHDYHYRLQSQGDGDGEEGPDSVQEQGGQGHGSDPRGA